MRTEALVKALSAFSKRLMRNIEHVWCVLMSRRVMEATMLPDECCFALCAVRETAEAKAAAP